MELTLHKPTREDLHDLLSITAGCLALALGNHFFKFPNQFVFGGVTGIAVLIADATILSGGTDIIAMILKRQTGREIGSMLIVADCLIVIAAFFIFDIETALFSSLGLLIKSMLIDTSVARLNQSRMVNIICDDPEPVCAYIMKTLDKGATFHEAVGAYSHQKKYIVISAMKPRQEIQLRRFIRDRVPTAFVLVADSSLIFGKGFAHIG